VCLGSAAGACSAALQRTALVFAHATPDACVLARFQRPLQASIHNGAAAADAFCFFDLQKGWPGVPDGEEEFRVLFEARCAVTPIHADQLLHFWEEPL
jgi:hypothetical protein